MANYRLGLWMAATALAALTTTGCATKNWVKTQTAPIVDHTGQLEDKTAANGRAIRDTDERAQSGIKQAQGAADSATQNAQNATKSAGDAEMAANDAVHRADSLDSVVKGLDNYKPLANVTVNFGFDKAMLTKDDKDQLDGFAGQLSSAKSYILEVTGGTDSIGSFAVQLRSEPASRRCRGAVSCSEVRHSCAPLLLIGIGKDQEVAPNNTADGRKQNRRVQIQLLSNMGNGQGAPAAAPAGSGQ